jgi:hypothetical protein
MEGKTLVKLAIAVAVVILIWKKGIPWWNERQASSAATVSSAPGDACVAAAAAADDTWGSGVGHFANPPYDLAGWDEFRSRVEVQARRAEEKCLCADSSCTTAKRAMSDLRSLVNEMDSSLRSGSPPPSDLVQRQEAIDNAINSARDLAKQGK